MNNTLTKRRIVFSFVIDEDPNNPIDPNELANAIIDQSDYINLPRYIMDIEYVDNETIEKGDDEKLINKSWNWT